MHHCYGYEVALTLAGMTFITKLTLPTLQPGTVGHPAPNQKPAQHLLYLRLLDSYES